MESPKFVLLHNKIVNVDNINYISLLEEKNKKQDKIIFVIAIHFSATNRILLNYESQQKRDNDFKAIFDVLGVEA